MLRNPRDHDVWWYNFPGVQQGLVISSLALGALLGSHIVLVFLSDSIGRRKEIRLAASLYIAGALLNIMAGSVLAPSRVWNVGFGLGLITLLCGRILTGVGVAFIMHGAPTYMAEMSPSSVRGTLVSAKETVIVFGIIVGMLMGDLMSDYPDYWIGMFTYCTEL
jgi:MFS family permease